MSLINDALKRARQEQKHPDGPPMAPLQPVEDSGRPSRMFRPVVGVLLLASLTCSAWFFWKFWSSTRESGRIVALAKETGARPAAKADQPLQTPALEPAIKVSTDIIVRTDFAATPRPQSGAVVPPPASNAAPPAPGQSSIPAGESNAAAPAVPAPPPSPFADVKLQSIIYREDKPAALINGEMLFVGDEVRGARVLKIDRQSVTIERKGETNELRLPRL